MNEPRLRRCVAPAILTVCIMRYPNLVRWSVVAVVESKWMGKYCRQLRQDWVVANGPWVRVNIRATRIWKSR